MGENQQKRHVVRGEKYGFYTVSNDAYFDSGPAVKRRFWNSIYLTGENM